MAERLPGGKVRPMPDDLQAELIAGSDATALWQDITTLARNEFICWVESAERDQTRQLRITRTKEELLEGERRPCCWPGCDHREKTGHWSGDAVQRRLCARKARAGWISTSSTNGWWSRPLPTSLPS